MIQNKNHTYWTATLLNRLIGFYFFSMPLYTVAQSDGLFDSLQTIIRTEVMNGTNSFYPAALAYDSLATLSGDTLKMGKGKNFLGMHFYYKGSHRQAIEYYLQALPFFTAIRDTYFIGMMNNNIGAAYEYRREPEHSIAYYQKALVSFTQLKDTLWIANVLNNIGIQYNVAEDHEAALTNFRKAETYYTALNDSASIAVLKTNIAENDRLAGRNAEAKKLNIEYLTHFQKFHTADVLGNVHSSLARIYLAMGQLKDAMQHNQLSIDIRTKNNFLNHLPNNYETESLIFEQEKNYKAALLAYKKFKSAQDSMFNKEKDERITTLIAEYDIKEKDQEIANLASQNELKTLRIEKTNRQKLIYGLGAFCFLLFAGAFYYLLRLKSKTNVELNEKNKLVTKALAEKDVLLREIHHRVKNNLQMISALLYLHGKSVDDESAQEALRESQNRVQSMAIIHQNLYQDDDLLEVSINTYLDKLLVHLISSYNIEQNRIQIHKKIDIPQMDVDTVIPLALIINELISNALKYAFRDGGSGEIDVHLGEHEGAIVLEVNDNGVGIPDHFSIASSSNFGLKLVTILCDRLGATWKVQSRNGTQMSITIPQKKAA